MKKYWVDPKTGYHVITDEKVSCIHLNDCDFLQSKTTPSWFFKLLQFPFDSSSSDTLIKCRNEDLRAVLHNISMYEKRAQKALDTLNCLLEEITYADD